jgi:hypothetical protein
MNKFLLVFSATFFLFSLPSSASADKGVDKQGIQLQDKAILGQMESFRPKPKKVKKGKTYGVRKQPKKRSCKSAAKVMRKRGNW